MTERPKLKMLLVVVLLINCLIKLSNACQYTKFSPQHTMCYYKTTGCPLKQQGLSKYEIQFILDEHNSYRQRVANGQVKTINQPQAADMKQMEWDNELALVAQKWAEQCKTQHDCSDCRQLPRFRVGQNIYMYASTEDNSTTDWYTAVNEWYKEVDIFPSSKIEPFQHPHTAGHYTQLAWANTNKIGCGYAYYKKGGWFTKLYVCDYGPGGNILGDRMYIKGPACSACPEGTSCSSDYPGLCVSNGGDFNSVAFKPVVTVTQKPWWAITPTTTRTTTQLVLLDHTTLPWWLTTRTPARPTFTKSPFVRTPVKKMLLNCDFDAKGCSSETMGSAEWTLDRSNSAEGQGNYYEVYLKRGNDGHLYIYTPSDNNPTEDTSSPTNFNKACLSFSYKKFPLNGKHAADLEVAIWRRKQQNSYAEFNVQTNAYHWTTHKMTIPTFPDVYSVSFHMSVPKSGPMSDQYLSIDQIKLDTGACIN